MVRKKRKDKNSFFREAVSYLKATKKYIFLAIAVFVVSSFVGFGFSDKFGFFNEFLEELALSIEGKNVFELIWFIFTNNVSSAFFAMIFGAVFGIFPIINAILNGTVLGYVFSLASAEGGFSVILYLVPHGIFELPAVFISLGLGIRLGLFIFAKDKVKELKYRFFSSIKVFLTIVLPLLIIAAIIEGIFISITR